MSASCYCSFKPVAWDVNQDWLFHYQYPSQLHDAAVFGLLPEMSVKIVVNWSFVPLSGFIPATWCCSFKRAAALSVLPEISVKTVVNWLIVPFRIYPSYMMLQFYACFMWCKVKLWLIDLVFHYQDPSLLHDAAVLGLLPEISIKIVVNWSIVPLSGSIPATWCCSFRLAS
jgi:hypothetical protein